MLVVAGVGASPAIDNLALHARASLPVTDALPYNSKQPTTHTTPQRA